jgi:hypothetical protein
VLSTRPIDTLRKDLGVKLVDVAVTPKGSQKHKTAGFGQGLCVSGARANGTGAAGFIPVWKEAKSAAGAAPASP